LHKDEIFVSKEIVQTCGPDSSVSMMAGDLVALQAALFFLWERLSEIRTMLFLVPPLQPF
jgi:hypothetical protein